MFFSKKMFRAVIAVIAIIACCFAVCVVSGAAAKTDYAITYNTDGEAVVTINAQSGWNSVYYTTDGSKPTAASERYTKPIIIREKTTIRVIEYDTKGKTASSVKVTARPKCADVSVKYVELDGCTVLNFYCPTPYSTIIYTTNGKDPTTNGKVYDYTPVVVKDDCTVKTVAISDGYNTGDVLSTLISVKTKNTSKNTISSTDKTDSSDKSNTSDDKKNEKEETTVNKIEEPKNLPSTKIKNSISTISNEGFSYVYLEATGKNNKIYYTLDGNPPIKDNGGIKYGSHVKVSEPCTFRAFEYNSKGEIVAQCKFKVSPKCAPVEMKAVSFTSDTRTIELTTKTKGAKIYYTLGSEMPTESNRILYTGPFVAENYSWINMIAVKSGCKDSKVVTVQAVEAIYELKNFNFTSPFYYETSTYLNNYRIKNGKAALKINETLCKAATLRAMELSVYFSSIRPAGGSVVKAIKEIEQTFLFVRVDEIIIMTDADGGEKSLLNAIDADNNLKLKLLDSDTNAIGVGKFIKGSQCYWAVIIGNL